MFTPSPDPERAIKLAIKQAIENNYVFLLEILLQAYPHLINQPWYSNYPPLHFATIRGTPETLTTLLELGCDPNLQTKNTKATPLYIAVANANLDNIKVLLPVTNIHISNKDDDTALQIAEQIFNRERENEKLWLNRLHSQYGLVEEKWPPREPHGYGSQCAYEPTEIEMFESARHRKRRFYKVITLFQYYTHAYNMYLYWLTEYGPCNDDINKLIAEFILDKSHQKKPPSETEISYIE